MAWNVDGGHLGTKTTRFYIWSNVLTCFLILTTPDTINKASRLIYMHNTTRTPILIVNIKAAGSQMWSILTSKYVLDNSKWEHKAMCQYSFQHTSAIPSLPLQFKGKERGRWAQLVEFSQNKLSNSNVLHSHIRVHLLLVGSPSYDGPYTPATCRKSTVVQSDSGS